MARDKAAKDPLAPRVSKVIKSVAKSKISKSKAPKAFTSADRITASDDEDMEDEPVTSQHKVRAADSISASERDSSDEDSDDAIATKEASRKRIERSAQRKDNHVEISNDDDEGHDGVTPEPSRSIATSSTPSSKSKSAAKTNGRIDNDIDDSQLRPTIEFDVPSGFKPSKTETVASKIVDMLNPKQTKGKEIWYISAPASLPITALKEVALEKFAKQQAIMEHAGEHYALVADPAARESTRILLPGNKTGYKVVPTPVNHVLQFQQVLNVQTTASKGRPKTTSQVLLDTHLPTKPRKKPQPTGMKMRFRPSGFGDGDLGVIGSSDEEDLPSRAVFRQPPPTINGEGSKKKKDKSSKLAKKHEAYVLEATTAIDADQDTAPREAVASEGKKKKKGDREGVNIATGMEPGEEPENGETISSRAVEESNAHKKEKKEKKRKRLEAEAEARAINGTATEHADEISEKKKKKKDKKDKRNKTEV